MDEFILPIDKEKFRSTNAAWNNLMLNDPWSVGYVSTLIELQSWKSKEEWERFYYESGEQRNAKLGSNRDLLNDVSLPLHNKSRITSLSWDLRNLNTQYGRTKADLMERAKILWNAVKNNGHGLILEDCFECVRFRVICETWNGIILRENNTISSLQSMFPSLRFEKTTGEIDHTYAVDFEVYKGNDLICGLQIKPKSYTWNAPYIQKARFANQQKYAAYTELKGVPVWTVISSNKGEIYNREVITSIRTKSQG